MFCETSPEHKVGYLQDLCNRWGDFRVTCTYKRQDGSKGFCSWRGVLDCWHSDEGLRFLSRVDNREILPCEIVLDVDERISEEYVHWICENIEDYHFQYIAYFTGSRGFHIHIYVKELAFHSRYERENIRSFLIQKFGCDGMKKSDKCMIAMEDCPHWKTGIKKTMVRASA